MTTVNIVHHDDLYKALVSDSGFLVSVTVSRGNRSKPWQDVPLTDLPNEVISKLIDQQIYAEQTDLPPEFT